MKITLKINNPNTSLNSLPKEFVCSFEIDESTTVQDVFSGDRHISMGAYYPLSAVSWGYEIILPYVVYEREVKWYIPACSVSFFEFASMHEILFDEVIGESDVLEIGGFITPFMNSLDQGYEIACVVYDYLSQNSTITDALQLFGLWQFLWCIKKCIAWIKRVLFSKIKGVRQRSNDVVVKNRISKFIRKISKKQKCNTVWYCYKGLKLKAERKVSPLAIIDFVYKYPTWDLEKLATYLKIRKKDARKLLVMLIFDLDDISGLYKLTGGGRNLYSRLQKNSFLYEWTEEEYLKADFFSDRGTILDRVKRLLHIEGM